VLYLKGQIQPQTVERKREAKERLKDVINSVKTSLQGEEIFSSGHWDDIEKEKFF